MKRGQRNYRLLRDAEFIADFTADRCYSMNDFGDYPAVCINGRHAIRGEIYAISARQFKPLDDLEWYPHFYQRIEIQTPYSDAWMYIVKRRPYRDKKLIPGVWP